MFCEATEFARAVLTIQKDLKLVIKHVEGGR